MRLTGLPETWVVRAVGLAGRDITDTPIVFSSRTPTTGLQIMLTDRVTGLIGIVVDRRRESSPDPVARRTPLTRPTTASAKRENIDTPRINAYT